MPQPTPSDRLAELIANDQQPTLSPEALEQILERHRMVDKDGYAPNDVDWIPTYDFNRAAAEGWRLKAGRVAADFNITIEGRQLSRSDLVKQFLQMAKEYARRGGIIGVPLERPTSNIYELPTP
jgi:hypothetical protein